MTLNEIPLTKFERRYHLPVMSECDADCRLCGVLGCLRPARLTFTEFFHELDAAALQCSTSIVFPPNFLNHPEAAQFCVEIERRGLTPLVRLRPAQLKSSVGLLQTLEYRSASFEVVVCEAVPQNVIDNPFKFKTVLVPTRMVDPAILYDSLPFSWRKHLEIMALPSSDLPHALTPDELFLFLSSFNRPLRSYADFSRSPVGSIPGSLAPAAHVTGDDRPIQLSCVRVVSSNETTETIRNFLDEIRQQSLPPEEFEICLAFDRVSDEVIEQAAAWTKIHPEHPIQLRRLPECWGTPALRNSLAFNTAAREARGSKILFLTPVFRMPCDLFADCVQSHEEISLLESVTTGGVRRALLLTTQHFFELAGFSDALEGANHEFELIIWKSNQLRPAVLLAVLPAALSTSFGPINADLPSRPRTAKLRTLRAQRARDFFTLTLCKTFYQESFVDMGDWPIFRHVMRLAISSPFGQVPLRLLSVFKQFWQMRTSLKSQLRNS